MAILLADPEATSKFFYKHAFLGYDQLISDGFYHIRKEFTRLPSLAELEANPQLASGQVVMLVDRTRDEPLTAIENLVREELPKLKTEADRAAMLANIICEAFGNYMGAATNDSSVSTFDQLKAAFGDGPLPVGELVAAGLGGARSRAIAFKAIADALPSDQPLACRLVRAPYPGTLMHELQLHAWNDVRAEGHQYVVDLMDDAGTLYEKASHDAAQYETLGREDDALLVKMLKAGLSRLPAGPYSTKGADIIRDEVIGKGASAEVYKVVTSSGETLAVKRMTDPHDSESNGAKQLFQDEVQILATLDHPNIVRLLGACETKGDLFIIMEYLEGGTLVDLLSSARELSLARRLEIALDVAHGLAYLHSATPAIIHRDVKGNNVLIGLDGSAKLTDFGVSVIMTNAVDTIEPAGPGNSHPHTVRYAAPEVLEGAQVNDRSDVYAYGMLLYELFSGNAPWAQTFPAQIPGLVLAQKRPPMPADAKFGISALIQWCWSHKSAKRPSMPTVVDELLNVTYNYLWEASTRNALGVADMRLLVASATPMATSTQLAKKSAQRQEFAARALAQLAGPEGDAVARAAMGSTGAVPALLQLLERGSDKGKEAAAEALGALVWVSFGDSEQRDIMRSQVLPALIQLLGATSHDGCRCAVLAALKTQISSPGTSDFRAGLLSAGGISALVKALQDGSMRAKAASSKLLLGFAVEGPDSQEWISAAPGAVSALVDLLRASDPDAVLTSVQTLIILVDIPHTRQDALVAGVVPHVTRLLGPSSDDTVTATEELAAVLLSKLALEPQSHPQIAAAAAIPVLARGIALARDAGRERMLIGVLRTLGAISENSTSNASKVIAARGLVPAFQLLSSRLPAVRQAAAFTLACLFSSDAAPADVAELTSIEGRLTHYLTDLLVLGNERDQAYGAIMMARVLTASGNAANVAQEAICNNRAMGALLTMLGSWDMSVQLAAVRALAKISWLGMEAEQPHISLSDVLASHDPVKGTVAIQNLTEMLESLEELTRYTAAKVHPAICSIPLYPGPHSMSRSRPHCSA
mmetsp:Transcript_18613/g.56177  ORF Transcript_18613/g.56177 Transcript_18613/m.56177 type:complete len:1043 (+) Transcript_18613:379-3507(+)